MHINIIACDSVDTPLSPANTPSSFMEYQPQENLKVSKEQEEIDEE